MGVLHYLTATVTVLVSKFWSNVHTMTLTTCSHYSDHSCIYLSREVPLWTISSGRRRDRDGRKSRDVYPILRLGYSL